MSRTEEFTQSIRGCARCAGDGHKDLLWRPFTHPPPGEDGARYTHWAMCPWLNEPILMRVEVEA